jgi:RNA polymerase sigma factor (sigma-70 family)
MERILNLGYKSVAEFCRETDNDQSFVGEILKMKRSPFRKNTNKWRGPVTRLAKSLGCLEEDLFSPEQLKGLKISVIETTVPEATLTAIAGTQQPLQLEAIDSESLKESLTGVLDTLPPREKHILSLRFGLGDKEALTFREIADDIGCSSGNIGIVEGRALRRLRHPTRARQLFDHIEDTLDENDSTPGIPTEVPQNVYDVENWEEEAFDEGNF